MDSKLSHRGSLLTISVPPEEPYSRQQEDIMLHINKISTIISKIPFRTESALYSKTCLGWGPLYTTNIEIHNSTELLQVPEDTYHKTILLFPPQAFHHLQYEANCKQRKAKGGNGQGLRLGRRHTEVRRKEISFKILAEEGWGTLHKDDLQGKKSYRARVGTISYSKYEGQQNEGR